jgi:uncharacterized protein (UPF0332 family)
LATWEELSRDSLRAAKLLLAQDHLRSSISRSYYAAYCAIAGRLAARRTGFPHGWQNPSHEQLPDMVSHTLPLSPTTRRGVVRRIRLLRRAREDADYRPGRTIERSLALDCIADATFVMREMGVTDE